MLCCLNPDCQEPLNPKNTNFCQHCGAKLIPLLRNRYRTIEPLSSGGFGKTYLAEDVDKLNEICVIKQFAPQIKGTKNLLKAKQLFEQEAMRLQQLGQHPQIPTLYAYFEEDNCLYLIQQYIAGQTLFKELKQFQAFSEPKIWQLLKDLLDILRFVHEHNVIHRDIKPENIIRRQSDGKCVLIDFGIAKQLTAAAISQPGTSIGSYGYVPIEQMDSGAAYPASDLYSLGATCFHLLTNMNPRELWKIKAYSWVEEWRNYLEQPISQQLDKILDKLLKIDRSQRYQSVAEILPDFIIPPFPNLSEIELNSLNYQALSHFDDLTTAPLYSQRLSVESQLPTVPPELSKLPSVTTPQETASTQPQSSVISKINHLSTWRSQLLNFIQPTQQLKILLALLILLLGLGGLISWLVKLNYVTLPAIIASKNLDLIHILTGHTSFVNYVVISPDGQTLVSGGADNTIKLWNIKTGKLIKTLTGHTSFINYLVISPDGQTLASASADNTINLWNLKKKEKIKTLTGHSSPVNALVISPDGQTLVSASADTKIKVWDLKMGTLKRTLSGHNSFVNCLAISPNGQILVSGSADNMIYIWDLKTGKLDDSFNAHTSAVNVVLVSRDGEKLISGSADSEIKVWDLKSRKLLHTLKNHTSFINYLVLTRDGKSLISSGGDNTIKLWNLQTGELKNNFTGEIQSANSLAFSSDGQILVSAGGDDTIKVWRIKNPEL